MPELEYPMPKIKWPIEIESAFDTFSLFSIIGQGGSGTVFSGKDGAGKDIAVKILTSTSREKTKRFKNEAHFLLRNTHKNIVSAIDIGLSKNPHFPGPFYVMQKFDGNVRCSLTRDISPSKRFELFIQILDGVEAAHLLGVFHRDLKPENILYTRNDHSVAVADFGIAHFCEGEMQTLVETAPTQRLANFAYAAPEQRIVGRAITIAADVYSLGLMLNEFFTGEIPHGTNFKKIADIFGEFAYLDDVVDNMTRQNPNDRPQTISEVKALIERYHSSLLSKQKIDRISNTVVRSDEITDPLANEPPKLVNFDWNNPRLTLILDRPINHGWFHALQNMGSYAAMLGHGPETFFFDENAKNTIITNAGPNDVQQIIDHFKVWLETATRVYKKNLEAHNLRRRRELEEEQNARRELEEARLNLLRNVRI